MAPLEPQVGALQREKAPQRKGEGTGQKVHIHDDNRWCLLSISYMPGPGLSPFSALSYVILTIVLGTGHRCCSQFTGEETEGRKCLGCCCRWLVVRLKLEPGALAL